MALLLKGTAAFLVARDVTNDYLGRSLDLWDSIKSCIVDLK
jgi:hypothetical protein